MASSGSPRDHSRHQQGIIRRAYEYKDTIALQRLSEVVSDLYVAEASRAGRLWTSAATALAKLTDRDDPRVRQVLANRDVEGLAALVNDLNASGGVSAESSPAASSPPPSSSEPPQPPPSQPRADASPSSSPSPSPTDSAAVDPEQLKRALKAFRKRLKLTRLNEESKLGRSPLSSGKASAVVAIMPPRDYPPSVWEELVRQGKLRRAGGSFYELVE